MSILQPRSPLREFAVKLASLSILLLPAAGCAVINIMAIAAGGGTWLVWFFACGSSALLLWLLKLLLPERHSFFADSLKDDHLETIVPTRRDSEMIGSAEASEITLPSGSADPCSPRSRPL